MNKFLTASVLLLLLIGQTSSYRLESSGLRHASDEEEYAVYAAVIERLFAGDKVTFDTRRDSVFLN